MKNKITIVSTARMGHGTFEAKYRPLTQLSEVNKVVVVRKDAGPKINKLEYRTLPKICKKTIFNLLITPFILIKEVRQNKANLILAYHYQPHFYFVYIASLFTGKPFIVAQTGTDAQETSKKPIIGKILKHVIKKAKYFNVPGKDTLEFWNNNGIPRRQLNVLHSTINVDVFKPRDTKKEYDIIFVGRLTEVKRIDKLINATKIIIKKYPKVRICIVGNGHLEKDLKLQVQKLELQDNFDFVGLQSNIYDWLNKASIFVMTSDSEGLPCAMMEAMSSELLCLGPDVNNMSDLLIEGETGFLFDTNDIQELADKLIYLLNNRAKLKNIRANSRELIIKEHSYQYAKQLWIKELDQIFRD